MGTNGEIVEEFAQVIKSMWSEGNHAVTPSQFKKKVGEFASQFKGSDQHDSQEFLQFLLDAVHEDLNLAQNGQSTGKKIIEDERERDESFSDEVFFLDFFLLFVFV